MRQRIALIDVWISLLMILVIMGHCMFPNVPTWYLALHERIYSFHMANFYFLCGFLVCHSYRPLSTINEYLAFVNKRLKKFGIPFLFFGLLICVINIWMTKGNMQDFLSSLKMLFIDPIRSPAIYLWFILVLFQFYLISPLLCQFGRYFLLPAFFIAILLIFYPLPRFLSLHQFSRYLLFFILGICGHLVLPWLKKEYIWFALASFPFFLFALWHIEWHPLLSSLTSIPTLASISYFLAKNKNIARSSEYLSRRCFSIYLWQVFFIQGLGLLWCSYLHSNVGFILFLITVIPFVFICTFLLDAGMTSISKFLAKCA